MSFWPRVPNFRHMGKRLTTAFLKALRTAKTTLGDVARGTGRGYRTLHAYLKGDRRVTLDAARDLLSYLRRRARELDDAADELERAVRDEEGGTDA